MKKKQLWLFLAKLVPLTLILGYLWFSGLQIEYPSLLKPLATPLFAITGVRKWWLALTVEHFTSLVPYIALVLSTPDLIKDWKRSLWALFGGVAIIVAGHLLMSVAIYHIMEQYAQIKTSYVLLVPVYLINDAFPLVLWLLFFPNCLGRLLAIPAGRMRT